MTSFWPRCGSSLNLAYKSLLPREKLSLLATAATALTLLLPSTSTLQLNFIQNTRKLAASFAVLAMSTNPPAQSAMVQGENSNRNVRFTLLALTYPTHAALTPQGHDRARTLEPFLDCRSLCSGHPVRIHAECKSHSR